MRRRRAARLAREDWVFGRTGPLARAINSQAAMAAITPRVPRVISLLELAPGRRYLDIGCGTAAYAHLVADRAGLAEPPVTVDLTPGPGPVDLIGWPEKLPFRDNAFDAISSFYFLRRFDDDVTHAFAEEIGRVLAPGGLLPGGSARVGTPRGAVHRSRLRCDRPRERRTIRIPAGAANRGVAADGALNTVARSERSLVNRW